MSEYILHEGVSDDRRYKEYEKREEIVRCKDCVHYKNCLCERSACTYCGESPIVEPDDFCSRGERKVDE